MRAFSCMCVCVSGRTCVVGLEAPAVVARLCLNTQEISRRILGHYEKDVQGLARTLSPQIARADCPFNEK